MSTNFFRQIGRRKTAFELPQGHSLKRVLGVRDLTFMGIAAIIGGGIFSSVGKACAAGGPAVVILFVICGIACGFAALCYAEFATRIPVSGSAYTYAYASFGELMAWIIGWALLMEYSIGNIYIAFAWSGYFTHLLDNLGMHMPDWLITNYKSASGAAEALAKGLKYDPAALQAWNSAPLLGSLRIILDLPAFIINILITTLVYVGVKESRNAGNAMVILKLLIIVLIIGVGAFYVQSDNLTPFMPKGFGGVMAGVSAVFFTYIGFDAVSTMAEESINPQRDLPRGMIYSLIICTVLYILISLVLTGMVNFELLNVDDPLAEALKLRDVRWLEYIVSVSAIVAMTSVMLVFQMGQPRIWLSMSRDGLLPKKFAELHPKHHTPAFSTIVTGMVVGIPLLFTDENFILDFTSIGTLFAFVLVCGGVLLLPKRKKEKGKFYLPYINGQYIFPAAVLSSIIVVAISFPGYFPGLLNFSADTINASSNEADFQLKMTALKTFNVSHGIFWIVLLLISAFSYLRKWSLIPLLGLVSCLYLLTGMTANNWLWFFIWFSIGISVYFAYGFRRSKLRGNEKGA